MPSSGPSSYATARSSPAPAAVPLLVPTQQRSASFGEFVVDRRPSSGAFSAPAAVTVHQGSSDVSPTVTAGRLSGSSSWTTARATPDSDPILALAPMQQRSASSPAVAVSVGHQSSDATPAVTADGQSSGSSSWATARDSSSPASAAQAFFQEK